MDWQALIGTITDYWNHVLLYAPDYDIDTIEHHRVIHDEDPFTPELFDRWLQIFHDTVDGGWSGPTADMAKKRSTGMARAMANRLLGRGSGVPLSQAVSSSLYTPEQRRVHGGAHVRRRRSSPRSAGGGAIGATLGGRW